MDREFCRCMKRYQSLQDTKNNYAYLLKKIFFFFESHIFLDSYHAKVVHADAVITLIVIVDTCKLLSYKHANKNLIL